METKKEYEYKGLKYKDCKISNTELEQKGVWLENLEILPPIEEKTQAQKRTYLLKVIWKNLLSIE